MRLGTPMAIGTAISISSDLFRLPDDEDGDGDGVLFEGAVVWLAAGLPEGSGAPEVVDGCT